jgi:ADP-ribosylglycohydrolase
VLLAVNHSGDSDSTGAITGNLLGAMLGADAIPERWLEALELRDEVEEIADDLRRHFEAARFEMGPDELERYPGW